MEIILQNLIRILIYAGVWFDNANINKDYSDLKFIREPFWEHIRIKCPFFYPMNCDAQFSHVFGSLDSSFKDLFLSTFGFSVFCSLCQLPVTVDSELFVNYLSLNDQQKI